MYSAKFVILMLLFGLALATPAAAAADGDDFPLIQFAGAGTATYQNLIPSGMFAQNMNAVLGAKDVAAAAAGKVAALRTGEPGVVRPVTADNETDPTPPPTPTPNATVTEVPTVTPTATPTAPATEVPTVTSTATQTQGYLTGGTRLPYPQSGATPTVYPGNIIFVYEQVKIKIRDTPATYATSIAFMSGDTYPTPLNTIPADASGVINLLDVSVNGYTGAYRIYDNDVWTGSYVYVWMPELKLDAWYAGSTDSVNGQTVSKSSSIVYVIDAPKAGPAGLGATAKIVVTTPVGGKTTMLGYTDLSAIPVNSARITTQAVPLGDTTLTAGIYQSQAEWTVPQAFANYAKKSNIISFSLGSSETLTITAAKDTVVRSNPFTVTVAGNPNTPYLISLDAAGRGTVPQMIAGQIGVTRGDAGPVVIIDGVPKSVLRPSGAAGDAASWGVVVTASDGNRIVEYSTTPSGSGSVDEGTYTVRVNSITSYGADTAGAGTNYDTAKVKITVGGLTLTTAGGDRSYYLGQEIKLTGTNTDSDTTYLFLTGANLNSNGVSLDGSGSFTRAQVLTDTTWSYTWDTGSSGLDTGSYTIYAVGSMSDKSQLAGAQYATISIQLMKPDLSIGTQEITAAKGDYVHIAGTAAGSPNGVAIFIFGANYYERVTTPVDNGRYDYKMYLPESMAAGQYYVVVEHPMYDGTFGVVELNANGQTILAMLSPNGGIQSSFVVEGSNRLQGAQAANALVQMLASPYIDDIFTTMRLNVQGAYITITPPGTPEVGVPFVLLGTTNLAVNSWLVVEIAPSSFVPGEKDQPASSGGISATVQVAAGNPNSWSYAVGKTALGVDSYTVRVSGVAVSASASAAFEVVTSPAVTPTPPVPTTVPPTPTATMPQKTPLCGLLVFAALAAVLLTLSRT